MILFATKRQTAPTDDLPKILLTQRERDVHYVNSFKCLGFTVCVNLDYEMHTRESCRKVYLGIQLSLTVDRLLKLQKYCAWVILNADKNTNSNLSSYSSNGCCYIKESN